MNSLDIIKTFGPPGIVGFLAGIAIVTLVRPETNKGTLFLILLAVCITVASVTLAKAIREFFRSRKPPKPPTSQ